MRDDHTPWAGHEKVQVSPLASAGAGAVGFYDNLLASCKSPGATVATAIDAVDITPGSGNVKRTLIQSLHNFTSGNSPEERRVHLAIFVTMLDRLNGERAVKSNMQEIAAGMDALASIIQINYNKGETADPNKTKELIAMVTAAAQDGCLGGSEHKDLERWANEQRAWEASDAGKTFKAHAQAERIAAASINHAAEVSVSSLTTSPTATPRVQKGAGKQTYKKPMRGQ